jgi:lipid-A-disaccharide synthase
LSVSFLLSCGEASGDLYAGALTRELRVLAPGTRVTGLGGPRFAEAGGSLVEDYRGSAVTGLTEPITKIPRLFRTLQRLVQVARTQRPNALIVIDFPDFNFRLARRVKRLGIPVVYYIGPQIWAWRASRLKAIRAFADRVLVIFPFEESIYRKGGVPVEFVGHPLVDLAKAVEPREAFLTRVGLSPRSPTVALLPGSRSNEVSRILPDLLAAARTVQHRIEGVQFLIARAPHLEDDLFAAVQHELPRAVVIEGDTDTVLASSNVAVTASGTATVQAALHDTPMIVVYRLSPLTYRLGRRFVKVDTFGMVNLIAGERLAPELIQEELSPEAVSREVMSLLTDHARVATMRAGLARVRSRLGSPGASRRAAEAVLRIAAQGV